MKQFLSCCVHIILLEFRLSQELSKLSKGSEILCHTEWNETLTPGQHRMMVQECIILFCEELNATEVKLHRIPCHDYLNGALPDKYPERAKKIYSTLCETFQQPVPDESQ